MHLHVLTWYLKKDGDGQDKLGHDKKTWAGHLCEDALRDLARWHDRDGGKRL